MSDAVDDPDLKDVFFVEAEEMLQELDRVLAISTQSCTPDNIKIIRRVFHTLKGSGKMVGLMNFGDSAYWFEGIFNKMMDGGLSWNASFATTLSKVSTIYKDVTRSLEVGSTCRTPMRSLFGLAQSLHPSLSHPLYGSVDLAPPPQSQGLAPSLAINPPIMTQATEPPPTLSQEGPPVISQNVPEDATSPDPLLEMSFDFGDMFSPEPPVVMPGVDPIGESPATTENIPMLAAPEPPPLAPSDFDDFSFDLDALLGGTAEDSPEMAAPLSEHHEPIPMIPMDASAESVIQAQDDPQPMSPNAWAVDLPDWGEKTQVFTADLLPEKAGSPDGDQQAPEMPAILTSIEPPSIPVFEDGAGFGDLDIGLGKGAASFDFSFDLPPPENIIVDGATDSPVDLATAPIAVAGTLPEPVTPTATPPSHPSNQPPQVLKDETPAADIEADLLMAALATFTLSPVPEPVKSRQETERVATAEPATSATSESATTNEMLSPQLRGVFTDEVGGILDKLSRLQHGGSGVSLKDLHRHWHTLTGVTASAGLGDISRITKIVETHLLHVLEAGVESESFMLDLTSPAKASAWQTLLEALRGALAAAGFPELEKGSGAEALTPRQAQKSVGAIDLASEAAVRWIQTMSISTGDAATSSLNQGKPLSRLDDVENNLQERLSSMRVSDEENKASLQTLLDLVRGISEQSQNNGQALMVLRQQQDMLQQDLQKMRTLMLTHQQQTQEGIQQSSDRARDTYQLLDKTNKDMEHLGDTLFEQQQKLDAKVNIIGSALRRALTPSFWSKLFKS